MPESAAATAVKAGVADVRKNPRLYAGGALLGFVAGALFVARMTRPKPCNCEERKLLVPPPWPMPAAARPPAPPGPWATQPGPAFGGPPPAAYQGPPPADTPSDLVAPAEPARHAVAEPGLADAFARFHAGDNRAYEDLTS